MEQFLSTLLADAPSGPNVLLIAPPPMKPGTWVTDERLIKESRQLAGCYKALAQGLGIHFADAGTWDVDFIFDGVHFSKLGHRFFAAEMKKYWNK